MSKIVTRFTKGALLTTGEGDDQISNTTRFVNALLTLSVLHNREALECDGTFTITLPDAAALQTSLNASASYGDVGFWVSLTNTGSGTVTVAVLTAANTLLGTANGTIVLAPEDSVILVLNTNGGAADGYFARGKNVAPAGKGLINRQIFTTIGAGTWTKPAGFSFGIVTVVGGGGGGGQAQSSSAGASRIGGGGGSGGTIQFQIADADVNATEAVSVGAGGGTGGASIGTVSDFGTLASGRAAGRADRGRGGSNATQDDTAGFGASAAAVGIFQVSSNNLDLGSAPGEHGDVGLTNHSVAGNGGNSPFGQGGKGGEKVGSGGAVPGVAGNGYGAGGGGGTSHRTTSNAIAGAGASGLIIVDSYG